MCMKHSHPNQLWRPARGMQRVAAQVSIFALAIVAIFYYQISFAQSQIFVTETNCAQIGFWEGGTCTLTNDVLVPLTIQQAGVTLDGNGYSITAPAGLNDATLSLMGANITIKNLTLESTAENAIRITNAAPNAVVENVIINNPITGLRVSGSGAVIRDVFVVGGASTVFGFQVESTNTIDINRVQVTDGQFGVTTFDSSDIFITESRFTNTERGVQIAISQNVTLEQSAISNSSEFGVSINGQSSAVIKNNQMSGGLSQNLSPSAGIRIGTAAITTDTVIANNDISNWGVAILDQTPYDVGGPVQVYLAPFMKSMWDMLVPTVWAQVSPKIVITENNFILNSFAYSIPIMASETIALDQNGIGNYWDSYDQPSEGCIDANNNQVCDTAYQLPQSIPDNAPSTEKFQTTFEPIVSTACNLYVDEDSVMVGEAVAVRFTTVDATSIATPGSDDSVNLTDDAYLVIVTATGTQTIIAEVTGPTGSNSCQVDVQVIGDSAEPPEPTGASSVLFLPGIQASRLYAGEDIPEAGVVVGEQLWEGVDDDKIAALAMDENGESVYDIYTEDVLDEIGGRPIGGNIYKAFLSELNTLSHGDDQVIEEYVAFAYDWRYSVFDVATKPVKYPNKQEKMLVDEVLRLAEDSRTDKVTIITHSNGGLVAKALLATYGDNLLAGKVDKLVMIGTPQLGAAKGVGALMHDYALEGAGDLFTGDANIRNAVRNMPGVYTLLPSVEYFTEVSDDPLITTDGSRRTIPTEQYGQIISRASLNDFLTDKLGVFGSNPPVSEPLALNAQLVQNSALEQVRLNAWRAADGVQVYEVVGTGLPTISGFEYRGFDCDSSTTDPSFCSQGDVLWKPKAKWDLTGDETVVADSAAGYKGEKVSAAVNLQAADDLIIGNRNHSDLTEVPVILKYINDIIKFPYISTSILAPEFTELRGGFNIIGGFSPIDLQVTTSDGDIVSAEADEIPGARYITFADSTYIILPDSITDYTLEVLGTDNGLFTLEFDELSEQNIQTEVSSLVASTTPDLIATLEVTNSVPGNLELDFDGDNTADKVMTVDGEEVVANVEYTYADLKAVINTIEHRSTERYLKWLVRKAERYNRLSERRSFYGRLESHILRVIDRSLPALKHRGRITALQAEQIEEVVNYLRN